MKADHTLDTQGLICPMPVVKTAIKFEELKVGQILEILATDSGIKEDIPAWCEATGNEFLGLEEENGLVRAYVKKSH
ncbi:MAG TPA: sulfurtransferase TusA family protein [Candidatus Subteraquimicrobiales bacterium]